MKTLRTRTPIALAIALALTLTPALAGCSVAEGLIESATGGDVDLGGAALPDGYPATEVPVIAGEIVFGGSIANADGKIYNVTVKVADGFALDAIRAQLEGVGFQTQSGDAAATAEGGSYVGTTDNWGVVVAVVNNDATGFVANYTVTSTNAQ